MVTEENHKQAKLIEEAGKELVDHIENLLKDVRIDLQDEHFPARRAAALYDPIGSNGGEYITFKMFQNALRDMENGLDVVFGLDFDTDLVADDENNQFAAAVRRFKEEHPEGISTQEAIGAESGALNLDALAEGMVPGFIKLLKNLLPDLPGLDALGQVASPISDYMVTGMPSTEQTGSNLSDFQALKYAAKDAKDQAKGYLKSSVGIQNSARKELQTAPQKLVNVATAMAVNKSSEHSPARKWHAWAIYPEVLSLYEEAREISEDDISDEPASVSYFADGGLMDVHIATKRRLRNIREELREYAVLLTACPAKGDLCCLVGILTRDDNIRVAQKLVAQFRGILSAGKSLNNMRALETPNYTKYFDRLKSKLVNKIIRNFDSKYQEVVRQLTAFFDGLGEYECPALDGLLYLMLKVLNDLRNRVIQMMRKYAASIDIERRYAKTKARRLFENLRIGDYEALLSGVDTQLDIADRCDFGDALRKARLVAVADNFRCPQYDFTFHRRGHPIPEGYDPDYPLLNLDPISLGNFEVVPGIEAPEVPTGTLEELFEVCRAGRSTKPDHTETAPSKIRRRK